MQTLHTIFFGHLHLAIFTDDHTNDLLGYVKTSSGSDGDNHAHITNDITSDERSDDTNDPLPSSFPGGSSNWLLDRRRWDER